MDRFAIEGGRPLEGKISGSGSKNATLPLMAASLLTQGVTVIRNVPELQDIRTMAMVLRVIGADIILENGTLNIDTSRCNFWEAPYELVRKMRASFYVLGPLIARFGKARVSLPGGCALGPRPVDLHLKGLQQLGCDISIDSGYVVAKARKLKGSEIRLDIASVGATGNLMMAALAANGVTLIDNAACEPEIVDLASMLCAMGAEIRGAGTPQVEVVGPAYLNPVEWTVIPDRIETATLLMAGAVTGGRIRLTGCRSDHLTIFLDKIKEAGADVKVEDSSVTIDMHGRKLGAVDVTTAVYPGFPTDLQPPWTALMSLAEGDTVITDSIYPERFTHVPELVRLGARIHKKVNSAYIKGVDHLTGAEVMCSDIRAAASLILATLAAEGRSNLMRVYHLDRGYERIEEKLAALGAKIQRISE